MADHKDWVAMKPKLRRAFAALKKAGIRAEMNFSISISNGVAEIHDPDARGYVFYHSQDHDSARCTGTVYLAFGSFAKRGRKAAFTSIGREVRDALVAEGLYVDWDETAEARPLVYASAKIFESQRSAKETAEQDDAKLEAEYEQLLPAWLAAIDASDFHDRLRAAAESMENCYWISHHEYYKAEKRHDAKTKKLGKVRIGLPLENKFVHPNGWVTVGFDNIDVYKNKHIAEDMAAACREQGLIVAEIEHETKLWLDLSEWRPALPGTATPTKTKAKTPTKTRTKAKTAPSKSKGKSKPKRH